MTRRSNRTREASDLAYVLRGRPAIEDKQTVRGQVNRHEWTTDHLCFTNAEDVLFAARSLADGAGIVYGFGNFYALACHPDAAVVQAMNDAKGRPRSQTASVTTVRENIPALFDWARLPKGLDTDRVMAMIDTFYRRGPFGFRGPAAAHVPDHLTVIDKPSGTRTVQLIAPGYRCPSNTLLRLALHNSSESFFAITSVNRSRSQSGREEPAHYRIAGAKRDLGGAGFVMLAHGDGNLASERRAARRYPGYKPMSVTIVGFFREHPGEGAPRITFERHGSLALGKVASLLSEQELTLTTEGSTLTRIACRHYRPHDPLKEAVSRFAQRRRVRNGRWWVDDTSIT